MEKRDLAPGQRLARKKTKPTATAESIVTAAIMSRRGLRAAAKIAAEAEALNLSGPRLQAFIYLLTEEIESRHQMLRALEARKQAAIAGTDFE